MKKLLAIALVFGLGFGLPINAQNLQQSPFPDVPDDYVNIRSITDLVQKGIVGGIPSEDGGPNRFMPNNRVTRAALLKVIVEAKFSEEEIESCEYAESGDESRPFDVEAGSWYDQHFCKALERDENGNRIIDGNPDGSGNPAGRTNFAELSKIISNANDLDVRESESDEQWFNRYLDAVGNEKNAIPFSVGSASDEVTRTEAFETVWRVSEEITDQVSKTPEALTNPFPNFESCVELEETFRQHRFGGIGQPGIFVDDIAVDEEVFFAEEAEANFSFDATAGQAAAPAAEALMAPTDGATQSRSASTDDFSQTNVQIEGIDEGDIVKTDGQFIYIASPIDQSVRIVEAFPAENLNELAHISFLGQGLSPQELYIDGNKLVVISTRYFYGILPFDRPIPVEPNGGIGDGAEPLFDILESTEEPEIDIDGPFVEDVALSIEPVTPYYSGPSTVISVFDIQNLKEGVGDQVELEREINLGGNLHTSRLLPDGNVLIFANSSPYVWNYREGSDGENLLPTIQDGDEEPRPLVGCDEVRYAPGLITPNYLSILSFDINDPDSTLNKEVVLANSESVMVSGDHAYVTNTYYGPQVFTDWDWEEEAKTRVYQFDLEDGDVRFSGRGEVEGTVINQFAMDEFASHLRVATTKGNQWDERNPSTSGVTVLDVDGMDVVGELERLAPGERIFSTRFAGNRLYMVTFRQVDPFFVIDLSDPQDPTLLGKLKLPGFSDYLHIINDDMVLGLGKDTRENKFGGVEIGGVKMSMFDVSDPENPIEAYNVIVGDSGTETEASYNHRAFFHDRERNLVGIPITEIQRVGEPTAVCEDFVFDSCPVDQGCVQQCTESCTQDPETNIWTCVDDCNGPDSCFAPAYERSETVFSGVRVWKITDDSFVEAGDMTLYTEDDIFKSGDYWGFELDKKIQRLVRLDETMYAVAFGGIVAADIIDDGLEEVNRILLK